MHALPLGPVEMRLPVVPEPAIGRPGKVRAGRLAPGGCLGGRRDRGGLAPGFPARLRGRTVGLCDLRRGRCVPLFGFRRPLGVPPRLLALPLGILACRVGGPGGGGAQVPAGAGMHLAHLLQLAVADAGALGEKPLEYLGTGREGRGLPHQRAVAVDGLAEGGAERHGLALVPDAG